MLSFKALSERKTKVKINPKQSEITEKNGTCPKTGDAECKCDDKTPAQKSICPTCRGTGKVDGKPCPDCKGTGKGEMSEAKKKDDSYLEVDFKKRQKNNEKARKEMDKVPSQKNPHFESTGDQAYGSQEEVSEESTEEVAETETILTFKQYFSEEGADRLRDARMERGGVGGNQRYDRPARSGGTQPKMKGKTPLQKAADKKYGAGTSAMDRVKADIAAKYGKGAIMNTKKKG